MAYAYFMIDVMTALRDRRAKAEAKVMRAAKALATAQKELADVMAAERVMAEITGESLEDKTVGGAISERDREIAKLLGTTSAEASTPVELHLMYLAETGDSINLDAFRTALWRLQKKQIQGSEKSWTVKSDNGRYWREAVAESPSGLAELLGDGDDAP
jgi:hypothetical protein